MSRIATLIPAYKPDFLAELFASLRSQTFKDFRVILSDDSADDAITAMLRAGRFDPARLVLQVSESAAISNIAAFHDSITRGDWSNPTVAPSVRSNLTTILGRTAAWRGARVSWDEMMSANEGLKADLSGLRS